MSNKRNFRQCPKPGKRKSPEGLWKLAGDEIPGSVTKLHCAPAGALEMDDLRDVINDDFRRPCRGGILFRTNTGGVAPG
jgi:hypothetical protein